MPTRGPKPIPTKVLALRGSWLAKTRPDEPQPPAMIPPMPPELDKQGKKIWRVLTRDLAAIGLLASLDQHALARYIQLWQRWQRLHAIIQEKGETYEVVKRYKIEATYDEATDTFTPERWDMYVAHSGLRAETRVWLALSDRLLRLEQQFGMTPSGRAAIGILLAGAQHYADDQEAPNPKRFLNLG
jgi:P27 family predicted phage terminase small subunit